MGCKSCIPNKAEIKIVNANKKASEINTELDLIDRIIEKRNETVNIQTVLTLDIECSEDIIKKEFFEDINNEKKLCNYLDKLQKTSNNKEYSLFYFYTLIHYRLKIRKKYTNLTFPSNIDEYINLIKNIKKVNLIKIII